MTCPAPVTASATSDGGAVVPFPLAVASGGRTPVAVACTPGSGHVFSVGTTSVSCTATDAAAVTASCAFNVVVSPAPRLARTHFLAFGDSITAGEVTVPLSMGLLSGRLPQYRQVVLPTVSYPTVLERLLTARYPAQEPYVVNAGRPGQAAADAEPRLRSTLVTDRPDVVLLLMGYNDLRSSADRLRAVATVERMAKDVRGYGARLFLATLTPGIPERTRSLEPTAILAFNDAMRTLAAGEAAVLVDLYQTFLPNVNAWVGVDGLHPTEAGYAVIAEAFYAAIRADLEER